MEFVRVCIAHSMHDYEMLHWDVVLLLGVFYVIRLHTKYVLNNAFNQSDDPIYKHS